MGSLLELATHTYVYYCLCMSRRRQLVAWFWSLLADAGASSMVSHQNTRLKTGIEPLTIKWSPKHNFLYLFRVPQISSWNPT